MIFYKYVSVEFKVVENFFYSNLSTLKLFNLPEAWEINKPRKRLKNVLPLNLISILLLNGD